MPDTRKHRGRHPQDDLLFSTNVIPVLRRAVSELSWLLSRSYSMDSALKLVGDRHALTARQRLAVQRSACRDSAVLDRSRRRTAAEQLRGARLGIDGYNVLITLESALSGGVILVGRDGAYRDLASLHGTYRRVEETVPALNRIFQFILDCRPSQVDFFLDRPVSNSARLRARVLSMLREASGDAGAWHVTLADSPDQVLRGYDGVAATSDSVILDGCLAWVNLAGEIIDQFIPAAWRIDFRD